jgi:hypothetical protein
MAFDPQTYKRAVTEEWRRAAQGWHDWIPKINDWLNDATEKMLDEAEVRLGSRVIDIAAGHEEIVQAPLRFASVEECLRWRREASGTMQEMLRGLDDEAKEATWAEIADALRQYETSEGFESPCELLVCSARK